MNCFSRAYAGLRFLRAGGKVVCTGLILAISLCKPTMSLAENLPLFEVKNSDEQTIEHNEKNTELVEAEDYVLLTLDDSSLVLCDEHDLSSAEYQADVIDEKLSLLDLVETATGDANEVLTPVFTEESMGVLAETLRENDTTAAPAVETETTTHSEITDVPKDAEETAEEFTFETTTAHFTRGYIRVNSGTIAYQAANGQDEAGIFNSVSVVYAEIAREGKNYDSSWLRVTFDTEDAKKNNAAFGEAYVLGKDTIILNEEVVEQLSVQWGQDRSIRKYFGNYLCIANYTVKIEATPEAQSEQVIIETSDDLEHKVEKTVSLIGDESDDSDGEQSKEHIEDGEVAKGDLKADVSQCDRFDAQNDEMELMPDKQTGSTQALEGDYASAIEASGVNMSVNEALTPVPNYIRTGYRSIMLQWNSFDSADYYEVYIKEGDSWRRKNKTTNLNISYSSLVIGQNYTYKVRAHLLVNGKGHYTGFSDEVTVLLDSLATTLDCQIVSRKKVLLTWEEVPSCDYYEIYRQIDNSGTWNRYKVVYDTTTDELSIKTDTEYQYRIRAHIAKDSFSFYGTFSAPVSVMYNVPKIQNFTSTAIGFTGLNLSWNNISGADYYEVYRKIGVDGAWTRNIKTEESSVDYSLSQNKEYYFKIRAHICLPNDTFFTEFSSIFEINTAIPLIDSLTLERTAPNNYLLSWEEIENVAYYEIYRITEKGGAWRRNLVIFDSNSQSYSIKNSAFCGYKVRARLAKDGERVYTPFSETVYIWNAEVPIIEITDSSSDNMSIHWNAITNADKYYIYADGNAIGETVLLQQIIDPSYVGSTITVSAVLVSNEVEIETNQSEGIVYEIPVVVNYRALVIGETAYATRLNGPENDMSFMSSMLNGLANDYSVIAQQNATLEEIIDLIDIAFEGATENDVSLFYYSGHGVTGSTKYYSGALQTVDYQYITTIDLAEMLSNVPGKVIVILDSCGSGAAISDGTENTISVHASDQSDENCILDSEEAFPFDAEQFNNGVIDAFSSYDSVISKTAGSSRPGGPLKAGDLKQTKFYVITGSAYEENSLTTQIDGVWGGVLTRGIAYGTGCRYPSGSYSGTMPADTNTDNEINFSELAVYCRNYAGDSQHVLSYSASPNCLLFTRE